MSLKAERLQLTSEVERYGQVTYNDGQFAEVQLIGMDGHVLYPEKGHCPAWRNASDLIYTLT